MVQIKSRSFKKLFFFPIQTESSFFFWKEFRRKSWWRLGPNQKSARSSRRSRSLAGSGKRGRELRPHEAPSQASKRAKRIKQIQIEARRIRGQRRGAFQNEATKRKGIPRTEGPGGRKSKKRDGGERRTDWEKTDGESSRGGLGLAESGVGSRRRGEEDFLGEEGRENGRWVWGIEEIGRAHV